MGMSTVKKAQIPKFFGAKKANLLVKKNRGKSALCQEKLIQARTTERSQYPAATSNVLTRNQEVIQITFCLHK